MMGIDMKNTQERYLSKLVTAYKVSVIRLWTPGATYVTNLLPAPSIPAGNSTNFMVILEIYCLTNPPTMGVTQTNPHQGVALQQL